MVKLNAPLVIVPTLQFARQTHTQIAFTSIESLTISCYVKYHQICIDGILFHSMLYSGYTIFLAQERKQH